jgi:DNA ligase-1
MKLFSELINAIDSTNKTTQKVGALMKYLSLAPDKDKLWLLALFTGKRPKRAVNSNLLKQWAISLTNIPEWLFIESYHAVGDLGETIALLLPNNNAAKINKTLSEWMLEIILISRKTEEEKKEFVINAWKHLSTKERFIFNKLLGGSFRIGVSEKLLIQALAKQYQIESSEIAHSLMGDWQVENTDFHELITGNYINTQLSKPYPFCLAYPIDNEINSLGLPENWQAEYKWDGIRGQFIKRNNAVFIWSRGDELINNQFPELVEALMQIEGDFVLDGEILAYKNGEIKNFASLQKRLNRKSLSSKFIKQNPVSVILYDLLELNLNDFRKTTLSTRRKKLEDIFQNFNSNLFLLPDTISFHTWEELTNIRASSRALHTEGLMLKLKTSTYHTGRKRGDWWKWKVDPLTIDVVLIYAQKGSGRRSAHYTDYTFAVKDGDKLVTIAKAYSGLTDKEIQEVSKFVNKNAIEKFGPVRTVKPELVFELAFEGISYSSRHKSGVALRFPRIKRWRKDKTINEIDDISEIVKLIQE